MRYFLLRYSDDWADEFDIDAALAVNESTYNLYMKNKEDCATNFADKEISFYFGSNEEMEYHTAAQFLERLEEREITQQEYETLVKLNMDYTGFTSVFWIILDKEYIPFEDQDDDEDDGIWSHKEEYYGNIR